MAVDEYGTPQVPADLTNTSDWHMSPDYHLQWMADHANRWGEGISLTLVVPGGLISGAVESKHAFLRGCAQTVRDKFDAKGDENAQKSLDQFTDDVFDGPAKAEEDKQREAVAALKDLNEGEDTTPSTVERTLMQRYLNLSNAWWYPGGAPPIELGHTRVLLSRIAAWTVGTP